jgi:hypothetical protein
MDKEIGMDTQSYFRRYNLSDRILLKLKLILIGMPHPCGPKEAALEIPGVALIEHVLRVDIASYPAECPCDRCQRQVPAREDVLGVIGLLEEVSEEVKLQHFCSLACLGRFSEDGQLLLEDVKEYP